MKVLGLTAYGPQGRGVWESVKGYEKSYREGSYAGYSST